jgi:hypothetical protein
MWTGNVGIWSSVDASRKLRGTSSIKERLPSKCKELSVRLYLELHVLELYCVTLSIVKVYGGGHGISTTPAKSECWMSF